MSSEINVNGKTVLKGWKADFLAYIIVVAVFLGGVAVGVAL